MYSPHTGKKMSVEQSKAYCDYKGEVFKIVHVFYLCSETGERFTDEGLDNVNLYEVYIKHAEKHKLKILDFEEFLKHKV